MVRRESKVQVVTTQTQKALQLFVSGIMSHDMLQFLFIPAFPQQKMPMIPRTKYFSYAPSSPIGTSPTATSPVRPQSMVLPSTTMQGEDSDRGNTPMHAEYQPSSQTYGIPGTSGVQLLGICNS